MTPRFGPLCTVEDLIIDEEEGRKKTRIATQWEAPALVIERNAVHLSKRLKHPLIRLFAHAISVDWSSGSLSNPSKIRLENTVFLLKIKVPFIISILNLCNRRIFTQSWITLATKKHLSVLITPHYYNYYYYNYKQNAPQ